MYGLVSLLSARAPPETLGRDLDQVEEGGQLAFDERIPEPAVT